MGRLLTRLLLPLVGFSLPPSPHLCLLTHLPPPFLPQLTKEEAVLDLTSHTALELHNRVRAFAGWPGTSIGLILEDEGAGAREGATLELPPCLHSPPQRFLSPSLPPPLCHRCSFVSSSFNCHPVASPPSLPLWFLCSLLLSLTARRPPSLPPLLSGAREEIELKVCKARVMQVSSAVLEAAGELQPEPSAGRQELQWGPGDTLLLPCKGGTVLEVWGRRVWIHCFPARELLLIRIYC